MSILNFLRAPILAGKISSCSLRLFAQEIVEQLFYPFLLAQEIVENFFYPFRF